MEVAAPLDPLVAAIAKQEELLRSMQHAHGEFHVSVSDDLAQLATLYNMRGDHARALTLLHKRLVIHEKHGPPERIGETLHDLGTTYRLQGVPDLAQQHLERALATRKTSHGDKSVKVAETLNSLALLHHARSDNDQAEAVQLQSLQVLLESDEPVDLESEDVPWEVYKRLKQQRGPSTAANSLTLLKGTMRQCVLDALANNDAGDSTRDHMVHSPPVEKSVAFFGATDDSSSPSSPMALSNHVARRYLRSKSDSAVLRRRAARDSMEDLELRLSNADAMDNDEDEGDLEHTEMRTSEATLLSPMVQSPTGVASLRHRPSPLLQSPTSSGERMAFSPRNQQPIHDAASLLGRVESIKRRLVAGATNLDLDIARLAADVHRLPSTSSDLRSMGEAMVGLVRELHRTRNGDTTAPMPVLEGHLEKKSASIFRGFERRFFSVDPTTFILSYHFSRDDATRGFAARGGFPVARISNIAVHRQAPRHGSGSSSGTKTTTGWWHFDVVVDLSTRHNPHATRTYQLRADSAETRRYWVETLEFYRAVAQSTAAATASPSNRPHTA